jgi:CHASE1-domain containing sensor protein
MGHSRAGASRKGSLGAIVREMRNVGPSTVWRRQILPCILAAIIGVGVSVTAGRMTAIRDDKNAGLQFEVIAENHLMVLQNGINEYVSKLRTVRTLFDSTITPITRHTFESLTRPLLQENSAIATLSWLPRVKNSERAEHERSGNLDGLPDYHIKDMGADGNMTVASERSEYYPIFYATVPQTSPLYGLDLHSEPTTLPEIEHARDIGRLGFSQIRALVSSGRTRSGFLFSLPVYRGIAA